MTDDSHVRSVTERWEGIDYSSPRGLDPNDLGLVGTLVDYDQEGGLREIAWFNARGLSARVAEALNRGSGRDGVSLSPVCGPIRPLVRAAISDPGLTEGVKEDGLSLLDWQTDAVMRVLAGRPPALALLVEAAAMFRAYEKHHRAEAFRLSCASDAYRDRTAKAGRNGDMAAKIESYLAGLRAGGSPASLEPLAHRPDCECGQCWPVVYVTGGMLAAEIRAAIPSAAERPG